MACGGGDGCWVEGEMVKGFFDEETGDSVAVEDEIVRCTMFISDNGEKREELRALVEEDQFWVGVGGHGMVVYLLS